MPTQSLNLSKLRDLIDQHFDIDGVRSLCFDLGVDFDNVPGDIKRRKIEALILSLKRERRLSDLVDLCQQEMPAIDWWHEIEQEKQNNSGNGLGGPSKDGFESFTENVIGLREDVATLQENFRLAPKTVAEFEKIAHAIVELDRLLVHTLQTDSDYYLIEGYVDILKQDCELVRQQLARLA